MKACLLALFFFGSSALAQTTAADALAKLKDQPIYLRGHWRENKLAFDAEGKALQAYSLTPFSAAGFDCRSAQIRDGKLTLKGKRVGVEFASGQPQRITKGPNITIEVLLPANGDPSSALDSIFATGLASLVPSMEEYWQPWAKANLLPPGERIDSDLLPQPHKPHGTPAVAGVNHIGGDVRPPRVLHSVDPPFSEMARYVKLSGSSQIYLWLQKDGTPTHFRITRPLGLGLDEQALYAISQYKFAPATRNGEPVMVDLYIDVNFQIF